MEFRQLYKDQLHAARARLDRIGAESNDTWNEVRREVDHAWVDVKHAAEAAMDVLRHRERKS
jgi:hypothetical protein